MFYKFGTYNPLLIAAVAGKLLSAGMLIGLGNCPHWRANPPEPALA